MITGVVETALRFGDEALDEALLTQFCQIAMVELAGKLKAGLEPLDCEPAFTLAAAWIGLEGMEEGTGDVTSFSVGDFSVSGGGGGTRRKRALALMKPYINLSDFAFCSVEG